MPESRPSTLNLTEDARTELLECLSCIKLNPSLPGFFVKGKSIDIVGSYWESEEVPSVFLLVVSAFDKKRGLCRLDGTIAHVVEERGGEKTFRLATISRRGDIVVDRLHGDATSCTLGISTSFGTAGPVRPSYVPTGRAEAAAPEITPHVVEQSSDDGLIKAIVIARSRTDIEIVFRIERSDWTQASVRFMLVERDNRRIIHEDKRTLRREDNVLRDYVKLPDLIVAHEDDCELVFELLGHQ